MLAPETTAAVEDRVAPLTIRLFGPFEASVHGQPLPRLRSRKGQWLLGLLTLCHGCELERAWLAGTLWPNSAEEDRCDSPVIEEEPLPQRLTYACRLM